MGLSEPERTRRPEHEAPEEEPNPGQTALRARLPLLLLAACTAGGATPAEIGLKAAGTAIRRVYGGTGEA
jgi:hypothetical protein